MVSIVHHERAARAKAWAQQVFPENTRKELQRHVGLTDALAHRVTLGRASDEAIAKMSRHAQFGDEFLLFVYGRKPLRDMAPPKALWFTPAAVHEAPAGHEIFARDQMGLPAGGGTDCSAFMRTNCGWVAATLTPGHLSVVAHDGAKPATLSRLRDWLAARGDIIRQVEINGRQFDSLAAVVEIDRRIRARVASDAMLSVGCIIERRPVETITAKHLQRLIVARHQVGKAPGTLPRLLQKTGVLPFSALYHRRSDGAIRTLIVGEKLGVDPVDAIGRELSERADKLYADNLRHRLEGSLLAPSFHQLRLPVNGWVWSYGSLAMADDEAADGSRIIAATVDIRSKNKVAA